MDRLDARADESSPEVALCERIRAGDSAAEASLMERLQPGLRLILHRASGGDRELTAELSQETLLIILRRLRSTGLDDPAGLAAFAAQTARNLVIAARRKDSRRRTDINLEALDATPAPDRSHPELISVSRLGTIVARVLDQLPTERDRVVLQRFYLHEEEKAEICRDLQLTDLAFNQVLFRARNRFRSLLAAAGFGKEDLLDSEHTP
jgi:RNA polymerase sigma-70 factor, ECF subfamily